jgi:hypothetical protein
MKRFTFFLSLISAGIFICGCAIFEKHLKPDDYKTVFIFYEDSSGLKVSDMKPILDKIKNELIKSLMNAQPVWEYVEETEKDKAELWVAISPLAYDLPVLGDSKRLALGLGFFAPFTGAAVGAITHADTPRGKFAVGVRVINSWNKNIIAETKLTAIYTRDPEEQAGYLAGNISEFLVGKR